MRKKIVIILGILVAVIAIWFTLYAHPAQKKTFPVNGPYSDTVRMGPK